MTDKIIFYYSSTVQTGYLDRHQDCIQFCKEQNIPVDTVDITEEPGRARNDGIITTPTIITKHNGTVRRHIGIVSGCTHIIQEDFDISTEDR